MFRSRQLFKAFARPGVSCVTLVCSLIAASGCGDLTPRYTRAAALAGKSGKVNDATGKPRETKELAPVVADEEKMAIAVQSNRSEEVRQLLAGGFDVNRLLPTGRPALHEAVALGHADLVTLLLESGAIPEIKDREGRTALDLAVERPDILRILKPELVAEAHAAFFEAVRRNRFNEVKAELKNGIDPNVWNSEGETALTLATRLGHGETVRVLLQPGVPLDVNGRNRAGESPLSIARALGRSQIEKMLLKRGANE